jgi:hypothetical protein
MSNHLERVHVGDIMQSMDRSYFPSVMLNVMAHNPGVRGVERDWAIFMAGVENGSQLGYERLSPILRHGETTIISAFEHVEKALALSDDLDIPALESLLAARNALAAYTKEAWDHFYDNLNVWASGTLGLRVEHLTSFNEEAVAEMALIFVGMMARKEFHPFYAWIKTTQIDQRELNLKDMRLECERVTSVRPDVEAYRALLKERHMTDMVREYVAWGAAQHKKVKSSVVEESKKYVMPTEKLSEWVATNHLGIPPGADDE